jgi:hypothetical protein
MDFENCHKNIVVNFSLYIFAALQFAIPDEISPKSRFSGFVVKLKKFFLHFAI